MKHFKEHEKQHQTDLLTRHSEFFYHDKGNGRFMGKERPFVLQHPDKYLPVDPQQIAEIVGR